MREDIVLKEMTSTIDDNIVQWLIDDLIVRLRERGYDFKPQYTLNNKGEVLSIKLVFCPI
jgi:hypothetical protein